MIGNNGDNQVLRDLAFGLQEATSDPLVVNGVPHLVTPEGYILHSLEHLLDRPRFKANAPVFVELASFLAFVNLHKEAGVSSIYVSPTKNAVMAVVDDHSADEPGRREFTPKLVMLPTAEWEAWKCGDRCWQDQTDFAAFLEEHVEEVVEPTAGDMLSVATRLEATRTTCFKRGVNLDNGDVQLVFEEQTDAQGRGSLEVPKEFCVALRPFKGGPVYKVKARFRYRITDKGHLLLRYELQQLEKLLEEVWAELSAELNKKTELSVYQTQ